MNITPTLQKDFYKADHRSQYPSDTTLIYSNLTARGSRVKGVTGTVFFGLQYFIKEYLQTQWDAGFFKMNKGIVIAKYKRMMDFTLGAGKVTTKHLEDLYDLGYLPLRVKALPEGTIVPLRVPMLTIENTQPEFFWLTNYIETIISCILWGPITSATTAKRYRDILDNFSKQTVGNTDFVQWQGHDFSMRGMFGLEAAAMSGAAHLLSFTGTDTIPAIEFLEKYYGANIENELVGASVPATEHSVMCAGGKENELETYRRLITETYKTGIVSIVSDTWNLWNVLTNFIPSLKDAILARDGKVVIRPDSGDPVSILCGLVEAKGASEVVNKLRPDQWDQVYFKEQGKYFKLRHAQGSMTGDHEIYEVELAEVKGVIEILWDIFGGTTSEQGFKVLDSHIGAIYGDSITPERAETICMRLVAKKFATTNVVLGIGSYTYQYVTRDTYGMAMKATYCEKTILEDYDYPKGNKTNSGNGVPRYKTIPMEIFKNPVTDNGLKKSAKGLLYVAIDGTSKELVLSDQVTREIEENSLLTTVFEDGKLVRETTLKQIRELLSTKKESPRVVEKVATTV